MSSLEKDLCINSIGMDASVEVNCQSECFFGLCGLFVNSKNKYIEHLYVFLP